MLSFDTQCFNETLYPEIREIDISQKQDNQHVPHHSSIPSSRFSRDFRLDEEVLVGRKAENRGYLAPGWRCGVQVQVQVWGVGCEMRVRAGVWGEMGVGGVS